MLNSKYLVIPVVFLIFFFFTACENISLQPGTTESDKTVNDDSMSGDIDDVLPDNSEGGDISLQPKPIVLSGIVSNDFILGHMQYALPDDLISGEFDLYQGGGGGIPFLKMDNSDDAIQYGGIELQLGIDGIFDNDNLIGVQSFANHSSFSEFTSLKSSVPSVTVFYSYDLYDEETNRYVGEGGRWYAFWALEGCKPVYALYLDAEYYDYEDMIAMAETVTFTEGAFFIRDNISATPNPNDINE